MLKPFFLHTLAVACMCSFAVAAPTDDADRAALLEGVRGINCGGVPGGLAVYGPDAFALVGGKEGKTMLPVAAAARWQKGRVVAFGHDGFLIAVDQDDTGRLLRNAIRWASGGKEKPRVGVHGLYDDTKVVTYLLNQGVDVKMIEANLAAFDVLIVNAMGLNKNQLSSLDAFVREGGGLITGVTGWGWVQIAGGNDPTKLATDCPGSILLKQAGIVFSNSTPGRSLPKSYATGGDLSLLNASAALDAVIASDEGAVKMPPERMAQCGATLGDALRSLPPDDTILRPRISALASKNRNDLSDPSKPVRATDAIERLLITRDIENARRAKPEEVKMDPRSVSFPGVVPEGAPRLEARNVSIHTGVPQWHGTGLYAPPGEVIRVTLPEEFAGKGYAVRIGCHTDTLWHLDAWKRLPEISRKEGLKTAETSITSAYGGLIYIEVPGKASSGKMEVAISGAIASPRFVLGETTVEDWKNRIRNFDAPWGELETRKIILTLPSGMLKLVDDPEALMEFWDQVLDADADLSAIPRERKRPERIVADLQISGGYMHSGYPIMTWMDESVVTAATLDKLKNGSWGHFHELGHNHQQPDWTFDGTVEVTCNLYSLYVMETLCGKPPGRGHERTEPAVTKKLLADHLAAPGKFNRWKNDPFLALIMYDQLRAAFGWDTYKKVFAEYRGLAKEERPKTEDEKRDQWLVRFSKAAGRNLGPFFDAWGVPTGEAARQSIADLPGWMPEDWP